MKPLDPIIAQSDMLFCSVPVPAINAHKGAAFDFTSAQIAAYGQSQTHPSVVYIPNGWNGHKYWLASTPYPQNTAVFESPCIYYGDEDASGNPPRIFSPIDGVVNGIYTETNNPIVKVTSDNAVNSDPDLWFDSENSIMWMISRNNRDYYAPFSQKSLTGQAWTPRGANPLWRKGFGDLVDKPEFLSPAIVKVGNKFRIYSLSGTAGIYNLDYTLNAGLCWGLWVMEGTTLEDGGDFSYVKKASILGKRGIEPWHMDMFIDSSTGYIYMICSANNYLTDTIDVYLAESTNGWDFNLYAKPLLSGGYKHYRPTAALTGSRKLVVYFSVTNAPTATAMYPQGASDVPVDGRAIGVASKDFDEILAELKADKVLGYTI